MNSGQHIILVQSVDVSMMHVTVDVRPGARTAVPSLDDGVQIYQNSVGIGSFFVFVISPTLTNYVTFVPASLKSKGSYIMPALYVESFLLPVKSLLLIIPNISTDGNTLIEYQLYLQSVELCVVLLPVPRILDPGYVKIGQRSLDPSEEHMHCEVIDWD